MSGVPPEGRGKMPTSKANQRAVHKYVKNNYDRLDVTLPKGKKDIIKNAAGKQGLSVNGFINAAVDEKLERCEGSQQNAGG